jgi:hypothetical protein
MAYRGRGFLGGSDRARRVPEPRDCTTLWLVLKQHIVPIHCTAWPSLNTTRPQRTIRPLCSREPRILEPVFESVRMNSKPWTRFRQNYKPLHASKNQSVAGHIKLGSGSIPSRYESRRRPDYSDMERGTICIEKILLPNVIRCSHCDLRSIKEVETV